MLPGGAEPGRTVPVEHPLARGERRTPERAAEGTDASLGQGEGQLRPYLSAAHLDPVAVHAECQEVGPVRLGTAHVRGDARGGEVGPQGIDLQVALVLAYEVEAAPEGEVPGAGAEVERATRDGRGHAPASGRPGELRRGDRREADSGRGERAGGTGGEAEVGGAGPHPYRRVPGCLRCGVCGGDGEGGSGAQGGGEGHDARRGEGVRAAAVRGQGHGVVFRSRAGRLSADLLTVECPL